MLGAAAKGGSAEFFI